MPLGSVEHDYSASEMVSALLVEQVVPAWVVWVEVLVEDPYEEIPFAMLVIQDRWSPLLGLPRLGYYS